MITMMEDYKAYTMDYLEDDFVYKDFEKDIDDYVNEVLEIYK